MKPLLFRQAVKQILNTRHFISNINLKSVFNVKPQSRNNFRLKPTGLFEVTELQCAEGFNDLKETCIQTTDNLIDEAISNNRNRKMVEVFDEMSNALCKVADLAEFIRIAHSSQKFSTAAENTSIAVSQIVEKLNTDKKLFNALRHVVENGDNVPTTEIDDHVASLFLFDFEQCGINLPEFERHTVVTLNDYILQLGQQFVSGTANSRSIKKNLLPPHLRHIFPAEDDDSIQASGLNSNSSDPWIRELTYRIFLLPEKNQDFLLRELLQTRHELALTCGFKNYAERALRGSILSTPSMVMEFLETLSSQLKSMAYHEFTVMNHLKEIDRPESGRIAIWDVPYYVKKYKKDKFAVISSEYSPYFSLGSCMEGLNLLFQHLYGIRMETAEIQPGEVWHEDVYKLALIHDDDGLLGYIYCDFYERSGKPNQDCHFTIRGGKLLSDGTYQLPVVVLMLNLPPPRWSGPSLLKPSLLDNLFHEMGHAMHSMLARTKYQHITGTRCSTDFAEVPSILMEFFASDPRVLRLFARHFQTDEDMPEEMVRRLCASKDVFVASETQLQLFYAALDQSYHMGLVTNTTEILKEVQNKYYSLPYVDNTAWQLRFSHLVGYGAKYYSYLVSKAVASWIWHEYFKDNPLSREQGERYRRECLAHGGGKPGYQLVMDYLQKEPTPALLSKALIREIVSKL